MSGDPQEPMDDSDRLKPCPFCGGEAAYRRLEPGPIERYDDGAEFIECDACGAATKFAFSLMDDARPMLLEWWNRRQGEISLRIKTEEHTCCAEDMMSLRAAANALLHQIDIGDFVDSNGHSAKMTKAVHDLMRALS